MHEAHIQDVDLNLIPLLTALLDERHISRAAQRAGLSQPAMSRALQRLRRVIGDELLVRAADGYVLTLRAERIRVDLATVLPLLDRVFGDEGFDPGAAAQTFRLAGTDYAVSVMGPKLFRWFFAQSPHSSVSFRPWHDGVFAEVERGELDLVFFGATAPSHLRSEHLFSETFVCLVAADFPHAGETSLSLEEYLQCSHLIIDTGSGEQPAVDGALTGLGVRRRVALTIPFHGLAATVVAGTPLVATMPSRLVADLGDRDGGQVRVLQAPKEIGIMRYSMAWHPRADGDRAHRWLRDNVRDSCAM